MRREAFFPVLVLILLFGSIWVLQSNDVVAEAMAVSLDKPLEWAVGFCIGNTELSLELWTVISGISEFDD